MRPLTGWLQPGPDFSQSFRGWCVHVERPGPDSVPVVILPRAGRVRRLVLRVLLGVWGGVRRRGEGRKAPASTSAASD